MRKYFGVDDDWVRPAPGPSWWRRDAAIALGLFLLSAVGVEALRATGYPEAMAHSRWLQYLSLGSAALLLFFRRQAPVLVMLALTGVHFTVFGTLLPETSITLGSQTLYFMGMLSAFAWARNRMAVLIASTLVLFTMAVWVAGEIAFSTKLAELSKQPMTGLVSPALAAALWTGIVNLVYFSGAIIGGQTLWYKARSEALVQDQHGRLLAQADQLAAQAVLSERVRIARELHDVVAHHVSLIGIQAAAARLNLHKQPDQAAIALEQVEGSSRQAVSEMRLLLRALRSTDEEDAPAPAPGLADINTLLEEIRHGGLAIDYELVDPRSRLGEVAGATSTTLYRVVQEALSNVRAHSKATSARVVLRLLADGIEAEITDSGPAKPKSSPPGFGLRGIRERIEAIGGLTDIGPRRGGGFRVRVFLPEVAS